jgi:DNA-binding IclR family transcriptional regulator
LKLEAAVSDKHTGSPKRTRQGIQSVEQGATLLRVFASASGPLSLRHLAAEAGMSASKAHRYLVSLLRCGLAHQDPVSGHYGLGDMALRMGLAALGHIDAIRFANEAIVDLNQRLDVMVALSVWGSRGPTVIGLHNRSELLLANLSIGSVLPLLRSASGKVFLAYLPRPKTAQLVKRELRQPAENTPPLKFTTPSEIEALVTRVRKEGAGVTDGDLVPGRKAVAAPVFDHQGVLSSVIAIIGVPRPSDKYVEGLQQSAAGVSRRLGFFDNQVPFVERDSHASILPPLTLAKKEGARGPFPARVNGAGRKKSLQRRAAAEK